MNKVDFTVSHYSISLDQWSPSPPWVQMEIHDGSGEFRVSLYPEDFRILAEFINSYAKNIVKTEKEMVK